MQVLKSELFATSNPYKFNEVPDYLDNTIESHPIYSLTTYFVDPSKSKFLFNQADELKYFFFEQKTFAIMEELSVYSRLKVLDQGYIFRLAKIQNIYGTSRFIEM